MSRQNGIVYNNPPLAGRPPFATDEPDSIYQTGPPPSTVRYRRTPSPDPNARTSAYDTYENYLKDGSEQGERNPFTNPAYVKGNNSGATRQYPVPLQIVAPRPGYAAPIAALSIAPPSPVATPQGRRPGMTQFQTAISVPSTPHPLQPPMTPIAPVFAKPSALSSPSDVKFAIQEPIMRSEKEGTLLPNRGERGDDFWRRFSMVVKVENKSPQKKSLWLAKTENGASRLSRWIWLITVVIILAIAGVSVVVWYISARSTNTVPTAVGGKENEGAVPTAGSSLVAGGLATSSSLHVSPTHTVDRREPFSSALPGVIVDLPSSSRHHRRSRLGRNYTH